MIDRDRLIEIFLEVAKIEGLSCNERGVADYIRNFMKPLGVSVEEDDTAKITGGNSGNLICKVGSGGSFALLAHMDTARSTGTLQPQVIEDRICSDGTTILGADDRAGVAVILYAVETAVKHKMQYPDFTAGFTVCEETTLAGSLNLQFDDNIQMAFVLDSSKRPGNIISQSYGAQAFRARFIGKASHSGVAPEKGISAIAAAAKGISEIQLGRLDDITTANIGKMNGGTATNVVPAETFLEGEARSLDPAKVEAVIANIQEKFQSAADAFGATLEFEANWEFRPYHLKPDMPAYRRAVKAVSDAGLAPVAAITPGGSDANSLNANRFPAVNFGIGAQNPHSNDEFILLEDLQKTAEIALALIKG